MDSTTVNFAIEKLSDAFQTIKPGALELGGQYVGFIVMKETLFVGIAFVIAAILVTAALTSWKRIETWKDPNPLNLTFLFSSIVGAIFTLVFLMNIYTALLANAFPLMFTIEKLTQ